MDFDQVLFKYDAREASSFSKAVLLEYMFGKYEDENHVLLLDSDMEVISPLIDLAQRFERSSILLTPQHLYKGAEFNDFKCGVYNAGFIGVSRTEEGMRFVKWWKKRLIRHCYLAETELLYYEQKWLNLVPALFDGVEIIKHSGYNIADWNLSERKLYRSAGGSFFVNGEPLYMFHFHSISELERNIKESDFCDQHPVLSLLVLTYSEKLQAVTRSTQELFPWSYQFYANRTPISDEARQQYRNNRVLEKKHPHPYLVSESPWSR